MKKCMEYEIELQTKRKTKEGQERLGKNCPTRKLNKEDALDRNI